MKTELWMSDGANGTGMTWPEVLWDLKKGVIRQARRKGWNGKNISVFLMPGYPEGVPANKATREALGLELGEMVIVHPYLAIRTQQNTIGPWVPTQPDMQGCDWEVLPK